MMGLIYMATNKIDGCSYVGLTSRDLNYRKDRHLYDARKGKESHFLRAIRKYGKDNFEWCILEEVPAEQLCTAEVFWIQYFKYIGLDLYNMTCGGEKPKHSSITKERISNTLKGHTVSESTRDKIKLARAKQPPTSLGKIWTEKEKRTASQSHRKGKVAIIISPDGTMFYNVYNISSFCREYDLMINRMCAVLNRRSNSHKGFTGYYKKEEV